MIFAASFSLNSIGMPFETRRRGSRRALRNAVLAD